MPSAVNTYGRIDIDGNVNGNKLTTNGLILNLDAGNPKSYPGTPMGTPGNSSVWYDLSPKGNHFYLYNTPTFDAVTKSFNFNGIDEFGLDSTAFGYNVNKDYIINTHVNLNRYGLFTSPATDRTIEIWFRLNDNINQYGGLFAFQINQAGNIFYNGYGDSEGKFVWTWDDSSQSADSATNKTVQVGEWIQLVVLLRNPYYFSYYVNGELDKEEQQTTDLANAVDNFYWYIARESRFGYHLKCNVSIIRMYDRNLTPEEIKNNYNINKSRFGLK
jgi:hypothetical protein